MKLRRFKITYVEFNSTNRIPQRFTVEVEAFSKYDAKNRFYRTHPDCEIIKVKEEEQCEQ